MLLALANQPFKPPGVEAGSPIRIPSLSWLPLPAAFGQGIESPAVGPGLRLPGNASVSLIPKAAIEPSFREAFAAAIGRPVMRSDYVLVVGSTEDRATALTTARDLRLLLTAQEVNDRVLESKVIQLEGQNKYFVILGEPFMSYEALTDLKAASTQRAIIGTTHEVKMQGFSKARMQSLVSWTVNAPIVSVRTLSQ